jgi:hypothetical protein
MMNILVGLAGVMLWMRISQKPYVMQVPERYTAAASIKLKSTGEKNEDK